jgi:hypothetical protein
MPITAGNGLLLKAIYADGTECSEPRTFLVIETSDKFIRALNVSSIKGKEHKLALPSNERILKYSPPFKRDSFVKLDALYEFEYFSELELSVLCGNRTMDPVQLSIIHSKYSLYSNTYEILKQRISAQDIRSRNPHLLKERRITH